MRPGRLTDVPGLFFWGSETGCLETWCSAQLSHGLQRKFKEVLSVVFEGEIRGDGLGRKEEDFDFLKSLLRARTCARAGRD